MKQIVLRKCQCDTCFLQVEFLYGEYKIKTQKRRTAVHCHPFWQLEVITGGSTEINVEHECFNAEQGHILIVPPGDSHQFIYPDTGCSYLSMKFNVQLKEQHSFGELGPVLINKPGIYSLYSSMFNSFEQHNNEQEIAGFYSTLEHVTASLVEQVFFLDEQQNSDPVVSKLRWLINSSPQVPLSVTDAVKLLKMNKKYVAAHLTNATGLTIKEFIDRERAEIAAQALTHSSQTIGEIAYLLGFADQYTFSRFFKRIKGCAPKLYRQNN